MTKNFILRLATVNFLEFIDGEDLSNYNKNMDLLTMIF